MRRYLPLAFIIAAVANLAAAINTERPIFGYVAAGFTAAFLFALLGRKP